jgi:hypothetical protein
MLELLLWGLAGLWSLSGLVLLWMFGFERFELRRARRELLRVAGGHAEVTGRVDSRDTGSGHPAPRAIAPRAPRIRRKWDGPQLSHGASQALLDKVFGPEAPRVEPD